MDDWRTESGATPKTGRVMLVGDDPILREVLSIYVETMGAVVWEAASAGEAVDILSAKSLAGSLPDVVVIDLPGVQGAKLGRELDRRSLVSLDRIVFLTASESNGELQMLSTLGARQCLHKPFELDDFRKALGLADANDR